MGVDEGNLLVMGVESFTALFHQYTVVEIAKIG